MACSMNRDQGRDLEKSKAKCGNHVVPLCDTNTFTAKGGRTARVIQVGGIVFMTIATAPISFIFVQFREVLYKY